MSNKVTVIVVAPHKQPYEKEIDSTLEEFQKVVGGYIEVPIIINNKYQLVCDEEGKLKVGDLNRYIPELQDTIIGTFFLCKYDSHGNVASLIDEEVAELKQLFSLSSKKYQAVVGLYLP